MASVAARTNVFSPTTSMLKRSAVCISPPVMHLAVWPMACHRMWSRRIEYKSFSKLQLLPGERALALLSASHLFFLLPFPEQPFTYIGSSLLLRTRDSSGLLHHPASSSSFSTRLSGICGACDSLAPRSFSLAANLCAKPPTPTPRRETTKSCEL